MFNKIKSVFVTIGMILTFSAPMMLPAVVHAQCTGPIQQGVSGGSNLKVDPNATCTFGEDPKAKVNSIITTVINVFSIVVGVVAVVMIIIGGFKYITSNGESSNISSAKTTIIYAIIGLVIVALAQFIVHFVLDKAINATTTG